ncbi:MAG: GyrI-like domain-containing protein [Anaerolineae bacterium]|nr:GyrI-like domain-containing protein [Anaerolineae bacterium]
MRKLDLKQQIKGLYNPPTKQVVRVDVPSMNFIMIDGSGNPNTSDEYKAAIEALYSVSYTLKFMLKKGEAALDYGVMPLEGLWWADDMSAFISGDKSQWLWTMMIMQHDFVSHEMFERARTEAKKKKGTPALDLLRFEAFAEGKAAQLMHIGPFSAEGPNIQRVHDFISASGAQLRGKHHEIYLSDIRKADPAKWKTVIRQPMT